MCLNTPLEDTLSHSFLITAQWDMYFFPNFIEVYYIVKCTDLKHTGRWLLMHVYTCVAHNTVRYRPFSSPQWILFCSLSINSLHSRGYYYSDFYLHRFILLLPRVHINGIIQCAILLCLFSPHMRFVGCIHVVVCISSSWWDILFPMLPVSTWILARLMDLPWSHEEGQSWY